MSIIFQKTGGHGEVDIPVLDPESGLEANNCRDFQVFINLVDLMKDIFMNVDCIPFENWIQPFCSQVISESSRQPLISGFYKLLTVALQLCDQLDYFAVSGSVEGQFYHLMRELFSCFILFLLPVTSYVFV
jgi:DNA-dependent protein kinase catalytic subunit